MTPYYDQITFLPLPSNFYLKNRHIDDRWGRMEEIAKECDQHLAKINLFKQQRTWTGYFAYALEGQKGLLGEGHQILKESFFIYRAENRKRKKLESLITKQENQLNQKSQILANHIRYFKRINASPISRLA